MSLHKPAPERLSHSCCRSSCDKRNDSGAECRAIATVTVLAAFVGNEQ